jgi:hypothetical protein
MVVKIYVSSLKWNNTACKKNEGLLIFVVLCLQGCGETLCNTCLLC